MQKLLYKLVAHINEIVHQCSFYFLKYIRKKIMFSVNRTIRCNCILLYYSMCVLPKKYISVLIQTILTVLRKFQENVFNLLLCCYKIHTFLFSVNHFLSHFSFQLSTIKILWFFLETKQFTFYNLPLSMYCKSNCMQHLQKVYF